MKSILHSFVGRNSTHQKPANSNQDLKLLHLVVSMTTDLGNEVSADSLEIAG